MLLAKQARSVTIPSLEIDQPDVRRASHSSSVGPIDETEIFYLMSRGIPRDVGAQVHRPRLPRAGRGAHPAAPRRRIGCARCSTRSGRRGVTARPPEQARRGHRRPRRASSHVVARLDDVPPGTMLMVQVDGTDILLVNLDGTIRAMQGICSHEYFELDKGFLTGDTLTCALHLSRFDLETGEALDPPAELPLETTRRAIEDGEVVLELPEGPIPINE